MSLSLQVEIICVCYLSDCSKVGIARLLLTAEVGHVSKGGRSSSSLPFHFCCRVFGRNFYVPVVALGIASLSLIFLHFPYVFEVHLVTLS